MTAEKRPRFEVRYDERGNQEDQSRKWCVIDTKAAGLVISYCRDQGEAEDTADLYERGVM